MNILMIEDSQIFVNIIKRGLVNSSFLIPIDTFHSEPTLQKGLDFLKSHEIDIIIVDIALPDSKSEESLKKFNPKTTKLPSL